MAATKPAFTPPGKKGDMIFSALVKLAALIVLLMLGGIIVSLIISSWPSIQKFGFAFLWTKEWDAPNEIFGALVPIYGTLVTSFIALLIAVPVSFGIALFLTELSPAWLKRPLGIAIELLAESRRKMQAKRRMKNRIALALSMATMAFGLFWLIWILMATITRGFDGMSLALFTEMTPPPNTAGGGLANALAGSGLLILWATVFGTPLGILAGIYLAEYGRKSVLAEIIRFINDILLSAPSIVVGLFVYTIVVAQMQHFSGWAGVIALALLQVPIVIRTTENMLKLVPDSLREAAYALGTPKWKMISAITLKASVSGIMTGILLAIARIAGETAPLLFTALSNQFWSTDMMQPIANLPVTIFKFAMSPFAEWQQLAWAGVLIITLCVLLLNILARVIFAKKKHG